MLILFLSLSALSAEPAELVAPSLSEVCETRYARIEDFDELTGGCEDAPAELVENDDGDPLLLLLNLQHLRGSRTRWQKGVASFFG